MSDIPAGYGEINIQNLIDQTTDQSRLEDCCFCLFIDGEEQYTYKHLSSVLKEIKECMDSEENCTLIGYVGRDDEDGKVKAYLSFIPIVDHFENCERSIKLTVQHCDGDFTIFEIKMIVFAD